MTARASLASARHHPGRFRQQDPILDTQLESRQPGSDLTAPILNPNTEPTPPMQRAGPPPRPSQRPAEHGKLTEQEQKRVDEAVKFGVASS
jgi:hypothetical protein